MQIQELCGRARLQCGNLASLAVCRDHREVVDCLAFWLGIGSVVHSIVDSDQATELCHSSGAAYIPSQRAVLWSWESIRRYSAALVRGMPLPPDLIYNAVHELMHADSLAAHGPQSGSPWLDNYLEEALADNRAWQVCDALGVPNLHRLAPALAYPPLRFAMGYTWQVLGAPANDVLWHQPTHAHRATWLREQLRSHGIGRRSTDPIATWLTITRRAYSKHMREQAITSRINTGT